MLSSGEIEDGFTLAAMALAAAPRRLPSLVPYLIDVGI
jgi:hypothetical protein